ncbi:alpha/beta fold hydrolase [Streptomyces sp. NPDC050997]|uniref:thioesterase II family protein n=1 Tax=Streptomyces sp. NPDC050997 TaxID=3155519 RepID=UPI0034302FA5
MRGGPERVVLKEGRGFHLICLPFAGGSARSFVRLARYTPPDWQVTAVQPPAGSAHGAAGLDGLASFYLGLLAEDLRVPGLVLGHSLGAAVAHRMAQLRSLPSEGPHLVLSAPPRPHHSPAALLGLDDRALFREATRQGMLPDLDVAEDFALRFLLPNLRHDLGYLGERGWTPEPLDTPPHLLGGTEDVACPPADLARLGDALAPRSVRLVEGGHMYVLERPAETARALVEISQQDAVRPDVAAAAG